MNLFLRIVPLVLVFAVSGFCFAQTMPATAPASQPASAPTEFAAKLLPEIQAIAKLDLPGAEGFAAALAGVLKKHAIDVPADLLKGVPSEKLPKLTKEQVQGWLDAKITNALGTIANVEHPPVGTAEAALRTDLLEAWASYAPSIFLRVDAAHRMLMWTLPDECVRSFGYGFIVDGGRAVKVANAAVLESFAAVQDGRDDASMKTLVGIKLAEVSTEMVGIEILQQPQPTKESLEKTRKDWDGKFAVIDQGLKDDDSKRTMAMIRKMLQQPWTDAQIEAMLLPSQLKPVAEAFFKALEKQDRDALKAVLTAKTAGKLEGKEVAALVKDMFGEVPSKIRLASIGAISTTGPEQGLTVPCNVLWTDKDGKEHSKRPEMHVVKTDKGWRVGEK